MALWIKIKNDGTGDEKTGFYNYTVGINEEVIEEGRIEWFPKAEGWLALIQRLVNASILKLRMRG